MRLFLLLLVFSSVAFAQYPESVEIVCDNPAPGGRPYEAEVTTLRVQNETLRPCNVQIYRFDPFNSQIAGRIGEDFATHLQRIAATLGALPENLYIIPARAYRTRLPLDKRASTLYRVRNGPAVMLILFGIYDDVARGDAVSIIASYPVAALDRIY